MEHSALRERAFDYEVSRGGGRAFMEAARAKDGLDITQHPWAAADQAVGPVVYGQDTFFLKCADGSEKILVLPDF